MESKQTTMGTVLLTLKILGIMLLAGLLLWLIESRVAG